MQKVRFNRTVSFGGRMYLRGTEAVLSSEDYQSIKGYCTPVGTPKRVDIVPKNTAMQSPAHRFTQESLSEMSWKELKDLAKENGVAVNQKRAAIEEQLLG